MKRFLFIAIALVMASGLILASCATSATAPKPPSAPAPAQSPVPTSAPSPTASPVTAPKPSPTSVKTWTLKLNYTANTTQPYTTRGFNPWAQDVEKATNGRVKIQHYPADTLMKSTNAVEGIKSGIAEVAWMNTGHFPGQFEPFDAVILPFITPSGEVASRVIWALYNKFPELQNVTKDFKMLSAWSTAPMLLETTKKLVKNIEDMKGMKIRGTGGPPSDMTKLLGAVPVMLSMTEVYLNLQKGVIDGALVPGEATMGNRLFEVAKYYTWVPTVTTVHMLIMNKEVWNEMPPDIQQAITSVSGEVMALRCGRDVFDWSDGELHNVVKKAGFEMIEYYPTPDELSKWVEVAGKPLWDSWAKSMEVKKIPGQKLGLFHEFKFINIPNGKILTPGPCQRV